MNQGWENFDEYQVDECQCVHLIIVMFTQCAHAALLFMAIIYSEKISIPVCSCFAHAL